MLDKIKSIIYRCSWIPLVCGLIGYGLVGKMLFWDSLYASIALYFLNPVSDINNVWVLLAKFTAVIVIANVILEILSRIYKKLSLWLLRRHADSTAVYCDSHQGDILLNNIRHGYLVNSDAKVEKTAEHIIMFSDDRKNIDFYSGHVEEFKDKKVYILLNEVDSSLIKTSPETDVHFFNLNEMTARLYWTRHDLYEERKKTLKIAIIGCGPAGKAVFQTGYLNNLYDVSQHIEYHIWGASAYDTSFFKNLTCANDDRIVVHSGIWESDVAEIAFMDRVILTEDTDMLQTFQRILYENPQAAIHCLNKSGARFETVFEGDNVLSFGALADILTEDNVKKERLYLQAKLFHYDYCLNRDQADLPADYLSCMEREWRLLNGFTKGSNIARADHFRIAKRLSQEPDYDPASLEELEHIRWCRYHYLNHWKYGEKDKTAHRHDLLVSYSSLPENEKIKDGFYSDAVRKLIEDQIM